MKKLISLIAAITICIILPITTYCIDNNVIKSTDSVTDEANLFTDEEEAYLRKEIARIKEKYSFDIAYLTVNDLGDKSAMEYADDYFDYNGFGVGENRDGVTFLQCPATRDYWTSTRGYGITVFTDYGIEKLNEEVVEYLKNDDSFGAFKKHLEITEEYLDKAANGKPIEKSKLPAILIVLLVSVGIGVAISFIITYGMISNMKTAVKQTNSSNYYDKNSLNLSNQRDLYMYSTVTKTKKPEPSNSSGSSTHTSSSGASHGGGGGKY